MFKRFSYTIFKKEYSDLFTIYGYGIDTIQHILHSLGYKYDKISDEHARDECIYVLKKLLEYDIIQVNHWGKYHEIVNELDLDIRQTILYIKGVWFIGADFPDFHAMPMFNHKDWYVQNLEKWD